MKISEYTLVDPTDNDSVVIVDAETGTNKRTNFSKIATHINSDVVHLSGAETITGNKLFTGDIGARYSSVWDTEIIFEKNENTTWWSKIRLFFKRTRGTFASPLATQVGDVIGTIGFNGHDGSAYKVQGSIDVTDNGSIWKMHLSNLTVEFWERDTHKKGIIIGERDEAIDKPLWLRYSDIQMYWKNNTDAGGVHFATIVDADGFSIWNRKWWLWWYPHKTADGTIGGFEEFISCSFPTYDWVSTYTKGILLNAPTTIDGWLILSGTGLLIKVGDDAAFHDVNQADTLMLAGQNNSSQAKLILGGGGAYIRGNTDGTLDLYWSSVNIPSPTFTGSVSVPTPTIGTDAVNKTYADGLVTWLLDYRWGYDASVNTFPASGGSGTAWAVLKGDMWVISVAGTLGGTAVQIGDSVIANVDTPGQTAGNWNILNSNISYVPEDTANKSTSVTTDQASNTKYPSVKSVYDWATGLFATISNLALKAPIASPTFTGTVSGITKSMVWLSNVDDTSDSTKNSATVTLTNKTITKPTLQASVQNVIADTDWATITFDLATANIHTVTLGGNRTLAVSNVSVGQVFALRLLQDATGSRTVTWFSTIKWSGGIAPTLTTTASKADLIGFVCTGSGTYDGCVIMNNL